MAKITAELSTKATTGTIDTAESLIMSTGISTTEATPTDLPSTARVTSPKLVGYGSIDPSAYIVPSTSVTGLPTLVYSTTAYSTMDNSSVIITDVPDEGDNYSATTGSQRQ